MITPPPLRDDHEGLMGLLDLSPRDDAAVKEGNLMLEIVCELIQFCIDHGVIVLLENPASSRVWLTERMQKLISNNNGRVNVADYCMYNKYWKKPTTFVVWNGPPSLALRRCKGHIGICSRTKKPHQQLQGRASDGRFWTKIAEPYPQMLVDDISLLCTNFLMVQDQMAQEIFLRDGCILSQAIGANPGCSHHSQFG